MKKSMILLLALMLLAAGSGCGSGGAGDAGSRADALRQVYAEAEGLETEAAVEVRRGEETLHYHLTVQYSPDRSRITVNSPEELSGVAAELTGETLALRYEDMVLDAGGAPSGVSAVNCVPLLLRAAAEGYVTEWGTESLGGTDALRVSFETEQDRQTLTCTGWFSEDALPLYGEIAESGKIIAVMEFTNPKFGAILLP